MNWKEFYRYENGDLFSTISRNQRYPIGRKVGYLGQIGYVRTKLFSKMTFAHRIVWEMFNGPVPEGGEIDHINGVKSDNRIENLRLVGRLLNCKNAKKRVDNKSGCTGVHRTENGKWIVQIQYNGERKSRRFQTKEAAEAFARDRYKDLSDFTERHGK